MSMTCCDKIPEGTDVRRPFSGVKVARDRGRDASPVVSLRVCGIGR